VSDEICVITANWPEKIKGGTVVDQPIHVVDMYPTLAVLAGAPLGKAKPLDGVDVWPVISQGKPSPREEVVYNVEPLGAGIRKGDWKLVWQAALPSQVELFDLAKDLSETINVADKNPEKVAELQKRAQELARQSVPPLLLNEALGVVKRELMGSVSLSEEKELEIQP
jgi:arylsulfatase A-like enzyme